MKKLSLFLFLIFGLSCLTNAQEPATNRNVHPRPAKPAVAKEEKGAVDIQALIASKLPAPEKETCRAIEMESNQSALAGKIVKIKFNRITDIKKLGKGPWYAGNLRSSEKSSGDLYSSHPGIDVIFSNGGLGYFTKFIPDFGYVQNDVSDLIKPDLGEVYVRIKRNAKAASIVVGDRYERDGDEGTYKWSTDTEVPDLTAKDKVTANDVLLFPDQLNGKMVVVEFYDVQKSPNKPVDQPPVYISCGYGHANVQTSFPPEGKTFFKTIAEQKNFPKANTMYAVVSVSRSGIVTLEAKGRRASGSGDEATYKW